jgi:hypothetical protein
MPVPERTWLMVEVGVNRPAHLYLIYLDGRGEAAPLYPWKGYRWVELQRPPARSFLKWPEDLTTPFDPSELGPSDIDTVLLLVRDRPFSDEENHRLAAELGGRRKQGKHGLLTGTVDLAVHEEPTFTHLSDKACLRGLADHPVPRLLELMRQRLHGMAAEMRAVCFSFQAGDRIPGPGPMGPGPGPAGVQP